LDLYALLQNHIGYFLLIFARISGIFSTAPVFGAMVVPNTAKAGLALMLSLIAAPLLLAQTHPPIPETFLAYALIVVSEFLVGAIIGYVAYLAFYGIQMAGAILDIQIGFGMVNVIDPQFGQSIPLIGNFQYLLALLIFFATNSHHLFLAAVFSTFQIVPLAQAISFSSLALHLAEIINNVFVIAVKIALPVVVSLFLTEVALGILAKTMPQLNIFVVGIPARIIVGLFVLFLAIPFYIVFLEVLFNGMFSDINRVLEGIRGLGP